MAKDIYHNIVKEALIKDGWTITHDPFTILPKAEGAWKQIWGLRN